MSLATRWDQDGTDSPGWMRSGLNPGVKTLGKC